MGDLNIYIISVCITKSTIIKMKITPITNELLKEAVFYHVSKWLLLPLRQKLLSVLEEGMRVSLKDQERGFIECWFCLSLKTTPFIVFLLGRVDLKHFTERTPPSLTSLLLLGLRWQWAGSFSQIRTRERKLTKEANCITDPSEGFFSSWKSSKEDASAFVKRLWVPNSSPGFCYY